MPVTVKRGPVQYQEVELEPVELEQDPEEYSFWESVADSYEVDSYIGQSLNVFRQTFERNRNFRPGEQYDGLDHIPKGYEQYAEAYAWSQNQAETDAITARIDSTNEARKRLDTLPTIDRLMAGLMTGVVDPVNLVGGPSLKGVGFLAGVGRGALAIGSVNAGTEALRHSLDPTSTIEETAVNIGFGYALAGLIGGGIGHFTRNADARTGTINLRGEQRARAEEVGDNFARAVNAVEGVAVVDAIDFNGQGVRIIDGPTGKVDQAGNPVRAFYRSKEAQEQIRYRDRVTQAADDALGDVIPEAVEEAAPPPRPDLPVNLDELAEGAVRVADNTLDDADAALPMGERGAGETAEPDAGGARAADAPEELEDVIYIDTAAIRAEFPNKPWTRPRYAGIDPLPEDAFKTEAEWLNFVAMHELYHATTKRLAGESVAAYENRINRLAYEDIQGGRLPFSPTDSAAEKLLLLPTPSGTLMRLAPRNADVHGLAQMIAGDMSTLTLANRAGQPTTAGGSVFQKANRWLKEYFVVHVAMRKAYARYVRGQASESNFMQAVDVLRAQMPVIGDGRAAGKLTYDEFRNYIGRAVFDDQPFEINGKPLSDEHMGIVRETAHEISMVLEKFEGEARTLGMFDRQRELQREIEWRQQANERARARLETERRSGVAQKINDEILERQAAIDEMSALLEEIADQPMMHRGGEGYYPRIYDLAAIRERYDDFVNILAEAFARENGDIVNPDILARARQTADNILGEGVEEGTFGFGGPRQLRARVLPITNTEVSDFIITDPMRVMGIYTRRMGAAIEMQRQFGSRNLAKQLDELTERLREQGFSEQKITDIRWEMEAMRDRVLGQFHGKDPLSWDNRVARAIKNFGTLSLMGRGIYAQTVDMARTLAAEGYQPLFAALRTAMGDGMRGVKPGVHSRAAGEGLEMVMSRMMAQLIEDDSALLVTRQTGIERGLAGLQAPFFNLNLMNPFTVMWKDFTSLMSAHRIIGDAKVLADAVAKGRTKATFTKREAKIMAELASWGIDLRGAQQIAAMPTDKTGGGLWLANLEAWEAQGLAGKRAREQFMGALSGSLRSNVVTPGPLQRAAVMDGVFQIKKGGRLSRKFAAGGDRLEVPLLSLPFQLLSFSMASSAKVSHAILSGRDRNRLVTVSALLAGGMFSTWLASGDDFEQMDLKELIYSTIDRSGIAGWMLDPIKRIEALTDVGPRSAMGMYQFGEGEMNNEVGAIGGPSLSIIAGMVDAVTAPDIDEERRARLLLRGLPMNGLVWWDESLKQLADGAADMGMLDLEIDSADSSEEVALEVQ